MLYWEVRKQTPSPVYPKFPIHHDPNFPNQPIQNERDIKPSIDREVAGKPNHENRKQDISARQTKSEEPSNDRENNVYPDAPSPALLRVPLSLGTFFIDLIARKC
jgi:hypothetical protein